MGRMMVISFPLDGGDQGDDEEREAIYELEEALDKQLAKMGGAFLDGHEFGGGEARIFMLCNSDKAAKKASALLRDLAGDVPYNLEEFDDADDV